LKVIADVVAWLLVRQPGISRNFNDVVSLRRGHRLAAEDNIFKRFADEFWLREPYGRFDLNRSRSRTNPS
jgi:hypothetical protein